MDELVKLVVKKTGISDKQARTAVDTVLGYLKDKLPEPLASQIDGLVAGERSIGSIEEITKNIGGLWH